MKLGLLLVDVQRDYLAAPGLVPSADELVRKVGLALARFRARGLPVFHVWTTVAPGGADAMPHWRGAPRCVSGSPGHRTPEPLAPAPTELQFSKRFYSAFEDPALELALRARDVDAVALVGLHTHACVRATAQDAIARGFAVWILEDAVGSDDPVHAAASLRWMGDRFARRIGVGELSGVEVPGADAVRQAAARAREAWVGAQSTLEDRCGWLLALSQGLVRDRDALGRRLVEEVGKPIQFALAEVDWSISLIAACIAEARRPRADAEPRETFRVHRRPLGLVGLVTPFNNPIGIPVGKIAPALLYGNAVLWKPSPAGAGLALDLLNRLEAAGLPPGLVSVVCGGAATARALMSDPAVDAVTLTGGAAAGAVAVEICTRRNIPLQAELGGNNASVVFRCTDLARAARLIAQGAFENAGQRCTANRRVVVEARVGDAFVAELIAAAKELVWGDPLDLRTAVGPMISVDRRDALAGQIASSGPGATVLWRADAADWVGEGGPKRGAWLPPTLVACEEPTHPLVTEESFGPVLVVQRAPDFDAALARCNGVRQGLVAALFTDDDALWARFTREAQAGVLKRNQSTANVAVDAPFGGIKASGVGTPEHGPWDRDFYTRVVAVYGG